jgi:adenylate cyclase
MLHPAPKFSIDFPGIKCEFAQLIDAVSGGHLRVDRYDGSLADVFQLQDEVCARIVSEFSDLLSGSKSDNFRAVHTSNLDAYELYVQARAAPYPPVPKRIEIARQMFAKMIEIDPDFAGGYAGMSSMMNFSAMWGHGGPTEEINSAIELARKAISVDETFGWSYTALAMAIIHRNQYEEAIAAAHEAIARQPNDADVHVFAGLILGLDGRRRLRGTWTEPGSKTADKTFVR